MVDYKDQEMLEISLSFFDLILGPRLIATLPWVNETHYNHFVSEFFDFHEAGDFFTHIFAECLSFNHLFSIPYPENKRGNNRLLMLTASVPINILKRKDLLQYYPSIENLFREWGKDFRKKTDINQLIIDGDLSIRNKPKPILKCLNQYLGELEFIINVTPETVSVPVNKIPSSLRN
jgi:hypothetical protein